VSAPWRWYAICHRNT